MLLLEVAAEAPPSRDSGQADLQWNDSPPGWRRNEVLHALVRWDAGQAPAQLALSYGLELSDGGLAAGGAQAARLASACRLPCGADCACFAVDLLAAEFPAYRGPVALRAAAAWDGGQAGAGAGATWATRLKWAWSGDLASGSRRALAVTGGGDLRVVAGSGGWLLSAEGLMKAPVPGDPEPNGVAAAPAVAPPLPDRWYLTGGVSGGASRLKAGALGDGGVASSCQTSGVSQPGGQSRPALLRADGQVVGLVLALDSLGGQLAWVGEDGQCGEAMAFPAGPVEPSLAVLGDRWVVGTGQRAVRAWPFDAGTSAVVASSPVVYDPQGLALAAVEDAGLAWMATPTGIAQRPVPGDWAPDASWDWPTNPLDQAQATPVAVSSPDSLWFGMGATQLRGPSLRRVGQGGANALALDVAGDLYGPPVLASDGRVYAVTDGGVVHAWKDARLEWTSAPVGAGQAYDLGKVLGPLNFDCARPGPGRGGVLYVPLAEGVAAVLVDSPALDPNAPWPKWAHDSRNTANAGWPLDDLGCR